MIKRTVEISQQPVHVTVRHEQLVLLARDDERSTLATIPCEDIGLLLVENPGVTYSHAAFVTLLEHSAAVVLCGRDHLPAGLLLPLGGNTQIVWRIHDQIAVSRPLRKQLWRQIVQAKIRAQARNLLAGAATRTKLLTLARQVRSGDPTNVEAQAAKLYWASWLSNLRTPDGGTTALGPQPPAFHRAPDGPPPNNLLNYGYAVLRAAVARAIVAAGLVPALGIHHSNRANAFCLADDLLEPLRPIVDACVRELVADNVVELDRRAKTALLELLTIPVRTGDEQSGPLQVALHRYVASLVKCFEGAAAALDIPVIPDRSAAGPDA